jgi:hypothetical protein
LSVILIITRILLTRAQIVAFAVCAVASGCMLVHWWRLSADDRSLVWKQYGWFAGLMSGGSLAGMSAFVSQPQAL